MIHFRGEGALEGVPNIRESATIRLTVNGKECVGVAESRTLLSDFLRHSLGFTGTHVGCEHGVCGACTVLVDGEPTRSCLLFAVQCEGLEVVTVEGLAAEDGGLHPLQEAFREAHALQCGFCTPGFLMSLKPLFDERASRGRSGAAELSESEIRNLLSGNLCRCTGYQNIAEAVRIALAPTTGSESE